MLVICLFTLFDPEGTIRVNGTETREFGVKLGVVAFLAIFLAIGSLLAFLPQDKIKSLFGHIYDQAAQGSRAAEKKK